MKRLAAWGPVVAWCGLIFAFSSVPDLNSGLAYDYPLRKAAHMAEYGVLALLTRRAGASRASAFVFSVFYAATDEWHQSFVPGRAGAASDVIIDGLGALTALLAGAILKR